MLVVVTRFLPGRRILPLTLISFASSGRDFDFTVYIVSSGSTVATGIFSVVVAASVVVVDGATVVAFVDGRRFGVG